MSCECTCYRCERCDCGGCDGCDLRIAEERASQKREVRQARKKPRKKARTAKSRSWKPEKPEKLVVRLDEYVELARRSHGRSRGELHDEIDKQAAKDERVPGSSVRISKTERQVAPEPSKKEKSPAKRGR